jgi:glycosyltransferase involved in cell wall biosynthesis
MQAAQFVVTVSDFNRQHLLDVAQKKNKRAKLIQSSIPSGADRPQVLRLYNGIDLDQFNPKANRVLESGRTPLILSVGRLVEKKGFEDLIRACGILRDKGLNFRCEIIGKGPREAAIRELIAQLNLNDHVRLLGAKPQDDVVAIYEQATVFALPCIVAEDGNRDGLPTVLLEAMAMGLPTVSTNLTGVPEIIDDESTGFLVPPQDPPALASALTRLLSEMALCKSMGDAARIKVAREFDLRRNVSTLHGWLDDSTEAGKIKTDQIVRTEISKDSVYENTLSVR